jgi:phage terminase small subunit
MPGRTATVLKEARGAYEKHPERRPVNEPQAGGVGPAPEWLEDDERAIWDETVSNCAAGVFQSGDRAVLTYFCRLEAESRRDWSKFSARKLGVLLSIAGRFGMTPADRARVSVRNSDDGKKKTGLASFR